MACESVNECDMFISYFAGIEKIRPQTLAMRVSPMAAPKAAGSPIPLLPKTAHQEYNNALDPKGHVLCYQVFVPMIKAWRTALNDPDMPGLIPLSVAHA